MCWDGATLHVACFAPPYDPSALDVRVVDWAGSGSKREAGDPAGFESMVLIPGDERWMGWGTVDPVVVELHVAPEDGLGMNATVANGYFVTQWPFVSSRRQPRLEAIDACGQGLTPGEAPPSCAPS